jgi:hypothetical protein
MISKQMHLIQQIHPKDTMATKVYDAVKRQLLTKGTPVRTQFLNIASIQKNTSACCFAVSCLFGCCCCKSGHACLESMDMGNDWKKTLDVAYHDVDDKRLNLLFMKAMSILPNIYTQCQQYVQTITDRMNQARMDQNNLEYTQYSLKEMMAKQEFDASIWLKSFYKMLYFYTSGNTIHEDARYVDIYNKLMVDMDDFRILVAVMPMFFREFQRGDCVQNINGIAMDKIRHYVMTVPIIMNGHEHRDV